MQILNAVCLAFADREKFGAQRCDDGCTDGSDVFDTETTALNARQLRRWKVQIAFLKPLINGNRTLMF